MSYQIEEAKKQLEETILDVEKKETKNEDLISEIKVTKGKIEDVDRENKEYDKYICEQENVIQDLKNSLVDLEKKKKEIQESNKGRSSHIDDSFDCYKKAEEKFKI